MTDLFDLSLFTDRTSSKSRRTYSQRNVSSLQLELTKNRKMINVKTAKTTIINRTMSFRPLPETNSLPTNVENTPMKKLSSKSSVNKIESKSNDDHVIEETPVKEPDLELDNKTSEKMTRDIQRLAVRLRSTIPLYDIPVSDSQSSKPTTLHLSQVVNRVSRCNYVLRHFVRQAEKYSSKPTTIITTTQSVPSQDKGRRRLFVDSPKQQQQQQQQQQGTVESSNENQPPVTPRKASGVIKQLFASPSAALKRTPSNLTFNDKRQKLF